MRLILALLISISFLACQNNTTTQKEAINNSLATEPVTEPEETMLTATYCFISSYGTDVNYKDTTAVRLVIIGDEVTGTYDWLPAEKDSARGTLTGNIKNGIITAIYDYMIEGSKQKEEVIFKMEVNQLLVKKGELEEVGDLLKLKNPAEAKFSEVIPRVICK